jgi:hypothetical protein
MFKHGRRERENNSDYLVENKVGWEDTNNGFNQWIFI